ncbi:MAG: hypothetical protein L0Y73_06160 [Candidatus Aminicenantes bacterium]|nr:hypothetical protein [Candidatus Aminicenantes bacterium]
MKKKIFIIILCCLLAAFLSLAAPFQVTGKWKLTTKTKKGQFVNNIEFVQDGEKLTMILKTGKNQKIIEKGTVKENNIQWTMTRKTRKSTALWKYSGVISGDTIAGVVKVEKNNKKMPAKKWSAQRVKLQDAVKTVKKDTLKIKKNNKLNKHQEAK